MSRKIMLSLAVLGTLASVALVAGSANAMVAHSRGQISTHNPGGHVHVNHPGHPGHPQWQHHRHFRYVWRHGYRPYGYVGYAERPVAPSLCTCLTKEYTPEGVVVFKDLCTKEMASAPVDGAPVQSGQAADPNNFAGKTYQDYLAANPQAQKN